MRTIVLGRNGQLAQALARGRPELICLGRAEFDLLRTEEIGPRIAALAPDLVINAAAYTTVDAAENEPEAAFALNRDAPREIARACERLGAALVHVSTDYVFDGEKGAPYVEDDPTHPINLYGHSKLEGEAAVLAAERAAIVRTQALLDYSGRNFVTSMLRLAETQGEARVVCDGLARPTWAGDLAEACLVAGHALRDGDTRARGVFHYAGADDVTWADYAAAIFAHAAPHARVIPVKRTEFAQRARRPADSRLDATKIQRTLGVDRRPWRETVDLFFAG